MTQGYLLVPLIQIFGKKKQFHCQIMIISMMNWKGFVYTDIWITFDSVLEAPHMQSNKWPSIHFKQQ